MAGNEGNQVEDYRLAHCDDCGLEAGRRKLTGLVKGVRTDG